MKSTVLVNPILSVKNKSRALTVNMQNVGGNSGNLIFVDALTSQLNYTQEMWLNGRVEGNDKIAVIPSANFIIHGKDDFILKCQEFLDSNKCSVTAIGLGAQLTNDINTPHKLVEALTQAKKHFLFSLSEKCVSFGIRGEITAEVLDILGIHNYRIIGCPSYYKYLDGNIPKLCEPSLNHTQVTVTPSDYRQTKIMEMGYRLKSIWLMQMMTEMPKSAFENETISRVWVERRFPNMEISVDDFSYYLKNKTRIFFANEDWERYLRYEQFTFAFGSRFHGNMAAFRMGVPTLWIAHDSRTSELINYFHLPNINIDQFTNITDPNEMLEFCDYSWTYHNYKRLCVDYISFLDENEIDHKFLVD